MLSHQLDTGDCSSGDRLRDRFRIANIWTLSCRLDTVLQGGNSDSRRKKLGDCIQGEPNTSMLA